MTKVETADLSGFPREEHYEISCQKLLWTGINYLSKVDNAKDLFHGISTMSLRAKRDNEDMAGIPLKKGDEVKLFGILTTPASLKEMEKEMGKAVNNDWTGAQHQVVILHLEKIAKHGLEWWIKELRETDENRIYEIDLDNLLKKP